jgi:beta-lactamase regulating signal transducer with metallopeptidase domain
MDIFLNWLWQGTVIALAAAVALRVSPQISATIRCCILWLALLLILLLPVGSMLSFAPDQGSGAAGAVAVGHGAEAIAAISIGPVSSSVVLTLAGFAVCWSLLLACQAGMAVVGLYRLKRRCRPFPAATEARLAYWSEVRRRGRRARLLISSDVSSAAVLGISSPVIAVAPVLLTRLSAEDLDRIVVHEWAHVQRRDDVVNLLQIVARAAVGWHPGVWWIDRQLNNEREAACDERAIRVTGSPRAYAACLARLAELRGSTSVALLAPGAAYAHALTERIERVLSRKTPPSIVSSAIAGMSAIVVITVLAGSVSSVTLFAMRPVAELAAATVSLGNAVSTVLKPIDTNDRPARVRPSAAGRRQAPQSRPVPSMAQTPPVTVEHSAAEPVAQAPAPDVHPLPPVPESGPLAALSSAPDVHLPPPAVVDPEKPGEATPWSVATDASVDVARGSQRAAEATAGFFTRLGKKVAKSF